MKTTPKQLVYEFFNNIWNEPRNINAIDSLMTEDYKITTAGHVIKGRDNFKSWVLNFQKLLLNARTESVDIFHDEFEQKVVSRWICTGKNNGLFGLEPDLKCISFTGIAIWTIKENKLSECWVERSAYELYQELKTDNKSSFV